MVKLILEIPENLNNKLEKVKYSLAISRADVVRLSLKEFIDKNGRS